MLDREVRGGPGEGRALAGPILNTVQGVGNSRGTATGKETGGRRSGGDDRDEPDASRGED